MGEATDMDILQNMHVWPGCGIHLKQIQALQGWVVATPPNFRWMALKYAQARRMLADYCSGSAVSGDGSPEIRSPGRILFFWNQP